MQINKSNFTTGENFTRSKIGASFLLAAATLVFVSCGQNVAIGQTSQASAQLNDPIKIENKTGLKTNHTFDFDGDGVRDQYSFDPQKQTVQIYTSSEGLIEQQFPGTTADLGKGEHPDASAAAPVDVATGDFDGNNTTDIIVRYFSYNPEIDRTEPQAAIYFFNKKLAVRSLTKQDIERLELFNMETALLAANLKGGKSEEIITFNKGIYNILSAEEGYEFFESVPLGDSDSIPLIGDFGGTGTAQLAVYNPFTLIFRYVKTPKGGYYEISTVQLPQGLPGIPFVVNSNGDEKVSLVFLDPNNPLTVVTLGFPFEEPLIFDSSFNPCPNGIVDSHAFHSFFIPYYTGPNRASGQGVGFPRGLCVRHKDGRIDVIDNIFDYR